MNENLDISSKKFMIILLVILVLFFLLVIKAFDYMSKTQAGKEQPQQAYINRAADDLQNSTGTSTDVQEQETHEQDSSANQGNFNVDLSSAVNIRENPAVNEQVKLKEHLQTEELTPIDIPDNSVQAVNTQDTRFADAQKAKADKQYVKALEIYKSIALNSTDTNIQAKCYEEMSGIYAVVKRYGTAISYAQKAYNIAPTSSREMLLARLYYKTGDIDKATKRVNNVLQRDFSND